MTVRAEALETLGHVKTSSGWEFLQMVVKRIRESLRKIPLKNSGLGIIETLEVDFDYLLNGWDP